jgi:tetratricopeptide (TPR) repeat protein
LLARSLALFAQDATMLRRFDEAQAALDEATALGVRETRARLRTSAARALLASMRGDIDAAAAATEEQLAVARSMGNRPAEALALLNLADIEHSRERTDRAIELVRLTAAGDSWDSLGRDTRAFALGNLTGYLAAAGDVPGALAAAADAIALTDPNELESAAVACTLEHTALALALDGRIESAALLAGYCSAAFVTHHFERDVTERRTHEALQAAFLEHVGEAERATLLARGEALSPAAAFAEARAQLGGASIS